MIKNLIVLIVFLMLTEKSDLHKSQIYEIEQACVFYHIQNTNTSYNDTLKRIFIDYGKKEIITNCSDSKQCFKLIRIDSFQYSFLDSFQCIKSKRDLSFSLKNFTVNIYSGKNNSDYEVKKIGEEEFLSVQCGKFSFANHYDHVSGTFLMWKNIPLKILVEWESNSQIIQAFKIDTLIKLDNRIFSIPSNIEILDMTKH